MQTTSSLATKIINLRKSLGLSQNALGSLLGVSSMAICRWEKNSVQPSATCLIKMGNLADASAEVCWDFWNMAGLNLRDVVKVLPMAAKRYRRTIPILKIVNAGVRKNGKGTPGSLVAIPFLPIVAAAGKEKGSSDHDLTHVDSEQMLAAPRFWCPNPVDTVCMRVKGTSMEPLLYNGYVIVVDQKQNERKKMHGKVIVAHHDKFGLVVSRFWQVKGSDLLVSDNRSHDPISWTPAWRIVGKVLWWIGDCAEVQL